MEEDEQNQSQKNNRLSSDRGGDVPLSAGKEEAYDEYRKSKEQERLLDSTCESILSSINEECDKIAREKENGIEDSAVNSPEDFKNASAETNNSDIEDICNTDSRSREKLSSQASSANPSAENSRDSAEMEVDEKNNSSEANGDDQRTSDYLADSEAEASNVNTDNVSSELENDGISTQSLMEENDEKYGENFEENDENPLSETQKPTVLDNDEQSSESAKRCLANNANKMSKEEEEEEEESMEMEETEKSIGSIKISSNIFTKASADDSNDNDDDSKEKDNGSSGKIKLRSLASLCGGLNDEKESKENTNGITHMTNLFSSEISGVTVGDIVQHSNIVESDESGVMHLKISNVVGGEDCITGLAMDDERDSLLPIQIASITSLIEPVSPDLGSDKHIGGLSITVNSSSENQNEVDQSQWQVAQAATNSTDETSKAVSEEETKVNKLLMTDSGLSPEKGLQPIVNIFRSPLVVDHMCRVCRKALKCEFRIVLRNKSENNVSFICSENCKALYVSNLSKDQKVQKPRLYFERICGMCGKELGNVSKASTYSWQTREFCNKLCLADHIGEVARTCFRCHNPVRVLYMVKYCVRFGSDVHQFCSNNCLESFKTTIKVCSFCQKNLTGVTKVISPANKEYCSNKCLKRAQRKDINQQHYKEEIDCTVCCKKMVNKYEFIHNGAPTWLCSDPCLNVFKYVNQVKSVNCCLCARLLNAEDSCSYFFIGKQLRVFCSESCFSVFVISARKIVTCEYCKVKKYNFDMICATSESVGECFTCSVCCLNFTENQNNKAAIADQVPNALEPMTTDIQKNVALGSSLAVVKTAENSTTTTSDSASAPVIKECNMCSKMEAAQFHMVMSDSTLRSFCSYLCATRYKCTFGFQVSGGMQSLQNKEGALKMQTNDAVSAELQEHKDDDHAFGDKAPLKINQKSIASVMSIFNPPMVSNKATLCRPLVNTKGVQCKPYQWHKESQTDESPGKSALLPIPIPVYVPTPMMMYSAPTPVPLVIPVPVPIPVFIPTSEKTTVDLEKRIMSILEKLPSDPAEAEMLLLAGKEAKEDDDDDDDDRELVPTDLLEIHEEPADEDIEPETETDLEMISRIQNTLPKFNFTHEKQGDEMLDSADAHRQKRKHESDDDEADDEQSPPTKRIRCEEDHLDLSYGVAVWRAWVRRKILEDPEGESSDTQLLQEDLSNMSSDVLEHCLIVFLNDLRSQEEAVFDVDTIFYLLLGIQKHIFEQGSTCCIFLELSFEKFTSAFDNMINAFCSFRNQSDPVVSKRLLGTRVTEEMLWEARQLGAHTPHVLLNTLFYFNTKIFHLKKPEDHFNLSFGQILKEWKRTKIASDMSVTMTTLLKYCPASEDSSVQETSYQMYENKDNPLRCPVKLYEFYLSKCPESIRNESSTYYVYPEQSCLPDSPVWFSASSLQMESIEKMLNRVMLVREVQDAVFCDDHN